MQVFGQISWKDMSRVTHSYKEGTIGEAERAQEKQRIDDAGAVLNQYNT